MNQHEISDGEAIETPFRNQTIDDLPPQQAWRALHRLLRSIGYGWRITGLYVPSRLRQDATWHLRRTIDPLASPARTGAVLRAHGFLALPDPFEFWHPTRADAARSALYDARNPPRYTW